MPARRYCSRRPRPRPPLRLRLLPPHSCAQAWRNFVLPLDIDATGISARLEHGELHLSMPKAILGGAQRNIRVPVIEAAA